jgi:hypothetical protein
MFPNVMAGWQAMCDVNSVCQKPPIADCQAPRCANGVCAAHSGNCITCGKRFCNPCLDIEDECVGCGERGQKFSKKKRAKMATKAVVGTARSTRTITKVTKGGVTVGETLSLECYVMADGGTLQDRALAFLAACDEHGIKSLLALIDERVCGVTFLGPVRPTALAYTLSKLSDAVYDAEHIVNEIEADTSAGGAN